MDQQKFKAEIVGVQNEPAVEVPFNPVVKWHVPTGQLWLGRRGYKVEGTINGHAFESVIVPRARSFFLILDHDLLASSGLRIGEIAEIIVAPRLG